MAEKCPYCGKEEGCFEWLFGHICKKHPKKITKKFKNSSHSAKNKVRALRIEQALKELSKK